MEKLTRSDLYSLEQYAENRPEIRAQVMKHKKNRIVPVGPSATLYFEDRQTIQYQIQEMLRVERIFEASGIEEELEAYNPLIPDGSNWKATFMIEYEDPAERAERLAAMIGVEDRVWLQVGDNAPVYAIADEDLDRSNDEKTSSVHFLRFELSPGMIESAHRGEPIRAGVDHPAYPITAFTVDEPVRASLVNDLSGGQLH